MTKLSRRNVISNMGLAAGLPLIGAQLPNDWRLQDRSLEGWQSHVTLPVQINERGGYQFAIDTAANCSVVASDIADQIGLTRVPSFKIHTLVGEETVVGAVADRLQSGSLDVEAVRLAVGERPALDGLDGLLGSDLLAGRRVTLNFRGGHDARIGRSRQSNRGVFDPPVPTARLVSPAESRFGGLLSIHAFAGGARTIAIVDTGSGVTILNRAAASAAGARSWTLRSGDTRSRVQTPTGRSAGADVMLLPRLTFADTTIRNVPILVGDFHTFRIWGIGDQPAMLLGIDVLAMFSSITIDLPRREFSVQL